MTIKEMTPAVPAALAGCIILAGGTGARLGGVSKPDYRVCGVRLLDLLLGSMQAVHFSGQIVAVAPADVAVPPSVRRVLEDPPLGGPLAGIGAGIVALRDLPDHALVALTTCDAPLAPLLWRELCEVWPADDGERGAYRGDCASSDAHGADMDYSGAGMDCADAGCDSVRYDGVVPVTADARDQLMPQAYSSSAAQVSLQQKIPALRADILPPIASAQPAPHRSIHYALGAYRLGALRRMRYERNRSIRSAFSTLQLGFVIDRQEFCVDVDNEAGAQRLARRFQEHSELLQLLRHTAPL
ncbi:MAG: NTP transferase domain-containing protein [Actinomycetaceae bacterium]|nr:NTP transferase domain-containing protein [Arcanobacterium sp.]MDD7687030.1 NTP transferase domain-containing protein [Actinomycetaceae bacterium]MDY5273313.1 NTP transferase domain-containing protein [Arcanobacterium sp.]